MKSKKLTLYDLLIHRPFCKCSKEEKDMYSSWCARIKETWEMWEEDNEKSKSR